MTNYAYAIIVIDHWTNCNENQIVKNFLRASKSKGLDLIAIIGYGHLSIRRETLVLIITTYNIIQMVLQLVQ
jgi:hypothetical protein